MNADVGNAKQAPPSILIATDVTSDGALIKKLLDREYDHVFISTNPDLAVRDFEARLPSVLVLAFDSLEKAERYYLGLYRLSGKIHGHAHRTIILCSKDEVERVFRLCRKDQFDDYVLFWPMTHDACRLPMSVHHALRSLAAASDRGPTAADFAVQARRLAEMDTMLDVHVQEGNQRLALAARAVEEAELEIGARRDGDATALRARLDAVSASLQPLRQWTNELKREFSPHLESVSALNALADQIRSTVMVVDDEEFQRKLIGKILGAENHRLVFAANGVEALSLSRKTPIDLILMDIMMPDMDGVEATRRLKAIPDFAAIPVIMITGKSDGNIVIECLKAGAADFVVKPIDRDKLTTKVTKALRSGGNSALAVAG